MTKEQFLGILRHALTTIGGILVTKGYVDESAILELSGAIVALVGVIWSVVSKRNTL